MSDGATYTSPPGSPIDLWPKNEGFHCRQCGDAARTNPNDEKEWGCARCGGSSHSVALNFAPNDSSNQPPPGLPEEFKEDWLNVSRRIELMPSFSKHSDIRRWRAALEKLAAGQRFKDFVHTYLTQYGVPEGDPTNRHQIDGCRIGARLDLLLSDRDRLRAEVERLNKARAHLKESYKEECELTDKLEKGLEAIIVECDRLHQNCGGFRDNVRQIASEARAAH